MKATGTLAVIYARFSDPKQDARSIDDQVHRCRQYAAANGMEVVQQKVQPTDQDMTSQVSALKRAESEDHYDRDTNFTPFTLKT